MLGGRPRGVNWSEDVGAGKEREIDGGYAVVAALNIPTERPGD